MRGFHLCPTSSPSDSPPCLRPSLCPRPSLPRRRGLPLGPAGAPHPRPARRPALAVARPAAAPGPRGGAGGGARGGGCSRQRRSGGAQGGGGGDKGRRPDEHGGVGPDRGRVCSCLSGCWVRQPARPLVALLIRCVSERNPVTIQSHICTDPKRPECCAPSPQLFLYRPIAPSYLAPPCRTCPCLYTAHPPPCSLPLLQHLYTRHSSSCSPPYTAIL